MTTKIAHCSDIQVRVFKRHKEFRKHFENFYVSLKEKKPNHIVLTGDIIHDKTHVSPELFDMEVDFFRSLIEIAPVHVIPGNHDCFTPGHQVLTKSGWINIEDYVNNNYVREVATFNQETGQIDFEYPVAIIKNEYNGKIYNIFGKDIELSVTENHNILYSHGVDKKFRKKKAKDITSSCLIPINGIIKDFQNNYFANLLGFSFAEATFVLKNKQTGACRIQFHLKSKREINYISDILKNLNYKFNIRNQKDGSVYICVYEKLAKQIYSFFKGKKQIPWNIFENDLNFLKSFLVGYLNGDGSKRKDKNTFWTYTSISQQSVEIINTIGRLIGASSHFDKEGKDHGNFENSKLQFVGNLNINNKINNSSIKEISTSHYEGFVYCLSVNNSNLLIRNKNKIFITGNCNLANLSRLDSLTPIFKAINSDKILYYKKSGIYPVENFNFVVYSCFDDEKDWPVNINKNELNIGLFHGMVQGARLQNGQIVEEHPYKLNQFLSQVDYLLLGDIHKMQILDLNYRAAYAGSLIQQNYAESIEKGYLLWEIESKNKHSVNFIELPNVCPFYTIKLEDDLAVPLSLNLKKNARIKVFSRSLTSTEKDIIQEKLNHKYQPIEIVFDQIKEDKPTQIIALNEEKLENLESLSTQEKLFKDFFKDFKLSEKTINEIIELNKIYDHKSKTDEDVKRNIQFKLKKMSFHNMFSYGENNEFDFSKYKGILGIFGNNGSGKSSIAVDIPLYTLFNKISKKGVVKNDLIINEKKDNCGASLEIELGNDKFLISRSTSVYGNKNGISQGKTEVDFKCQHSDGTEENKNGLERLDTDKSIKQIFGTPEDFMATSIAPQWELLGLINAGGTKRQELIGRYFDIDVFEQKNKLAKEDLKQTKSEIKTLESKKIKESLDSSINKIKEVISQIKQNHTLREEIKDKINKLTKNIKTRETNSNKFINKNNILLHSIKELNLQITSINNKIHKMKEYECIKNENCCLLKDLRDNELKEKELSLRLKDYNLQVKKNDEEMQKIIEENALSNDEIEFKNLQQTLENLNNEMLILTKTEGFLQKQIESLSKDKQRLDELLYEYQIFDYFLLATSKDGISKNIISKNLNIINSTIKQILSVGVNFEIELVSTDEGKAIEIFFKHQRNKPRRIELCSGMEKCIAGIALRAALVGITTLPRSNIFVLDEAFSSLDPEYVDAVSKMLQYLKNFFDLILIITHIDSFKDLCDISIEIARNDDGYSKILE